MMNFYFYIICLPYCALHRLIIMRIPKNWTTIFTIAATLASCADASSPNDQSAIIQSIIEHAKAGMGLVYYVSQFS
jgi:hypothetical protein